MLNFDLISLTIVVRSESLTVQKFDILESIVLTSASLKYGFPVPSFVNIKLKINP